MIMLIIYINLELIKDFILDYWCFLGNRIFLRKREREREKKKARCVHRA